MLHLHIYLADIFSRYATCYQHASANEPHADEQRSPSVYRMPREMFIQGISDHTDGYEDKRHTKICPTSGTNVSVTSSQLPIL